MMQEHNDGQRLMVLRNLLEPLAISAGFDVEDVCSSGARGFPTVSVAVDRDTAVSLDDLGNLSRLFNAAVDTCEDLEDWAFCLEVTTPGVDRPLTQVKHFRRAQGRKVSLQLADGVTIEGRLGRCVLADGQSGNESTHVEMVGKNKDGYTLELYRMDDIVQARVVVEFSSPPAEELSLAGGVVQGRISPGDVKECQEIISDTVPAVGRDRE